MAHGHVAGMLDGLRRLAVQPVAELADGLHVARFRQADQFPCNHAQRLLITTSRRNLQPQRIGPRFVFAPIRAGTALHASHF